MFSLFYCQQKMFGGVFFHPGPTEPAQRICQTCTDNASSKCKIESESETKSRTKCFDDLSPHYLKPSAPLGWKYPQPLPPHPLPPAAYRSSYFQAKIKAATTNTKGLKPGIIICRRGMLTSKVMILHGIRGHGSLTPDLKDDDDDADMGGRYPCRPTL